MSIWERQHVELLDPDSLDWQFGRKLLSSADPLAVTMLAYLRSESITTPTATEFFVLDGSITINGTPLGPGGYGLIPRQTALTTESDGATVLMFTYGDEDRPAVAPIDSESIPWGQPKTDKQNQGLFSKTLRHDETTGERLFLLRTHDGQADPRIEWHDCVEEIFQIDGATIMAGPNHPFDLSGGRYCYRPPSIPHGGFETIGGPDGTATMLVRVNSTLVNHYVERDEANRMLRAYGPGLDPRMVPDAL